MSDTGHAGDDLPDDLADRAGARLLAVTGGARTEALASLIAAHPQHERALRQLAADLGCVDRAFAGYAQSGVPDDSDFPERIAGHRVIRRLGAGAFGVVYLCAQEQPVAREVAVKVVRPGAAGPETLRRFTAERQLLAALNHPTLTPIFDAGELPDGRPYFVMEYVDGVTLRRYCDDEQLTVDARLRLFLEVCHGVEHAHRRGIVHRDLKPANVLVVARETGPVPKIIDFGIAKALAGSPVGDDVPTEAGRVVGTPGYMSPEQAAGRSAEVDARADVWALGVMLYELLTGELPWPRREVSTDSEPLRPSVRIASDATSASTQAQRQQTSPQKLRSRLRGDLDCIVLKALTHERDQRYASAQEFAADLDRHLRGEAILARPTHLGRRTLRLVRRHRVALAVTTAAVSLAAGGWLSLHFAAQADENRAAVDAAQQQITAAAGQAQRMSTEAEAAARALLARANDRQMLALPGSSPVRQALAKEALSFYERFLRERPTAPELREGRARALETLARVHCVVGQYAAAIEVAAESIDEARTLLATDAPNCNFRGLLANAHSARARARFGAGQIDASRDDVVAALDAYEICHEQAPQRYAPSLIAVLLDHAKSLQRDSDSDAQLAALQRAVAVGEAAVKAGSAPEVQLALADACGFLANQRMVHGDLTTAASALARAEQLLTALPEQPRASTSLYCTLAQLESSRGDAAAAITAATKGIGVAERWLRQEPERAGIYQLLSRLHRIVASQHSENGRHRAAAAASRAMVAVTKAYADRFPDDPTANGQLASDLTWQAHILFVSGNRADLEEAEASARQSLALLERADRRIDRRLLLRQGCSSRATLGLVLDGRGDPRAATHWQETVVAMREFADEFGVDARDAFEFVQAPLRLSGTLLAAGRTDEADEVLATARELLTVHAANPEQVKNTIEADRLAARLAVLRGDLDGACAAVDRLVEADFGWRGAAAAADGMTTIWRAAPEYRQRAIARQERAIDDLESAAAAAPADLWVTVPLQQSRLALAELLSDGGEHERAGQLLATALPALRAAREAAHANCIDEPLLARAQALLDRGGR